MELKTLDEIKNGTAVLMPSGIRAKLFLEDNNVIVEYPELYRDKYTKEQFTKIMEEGIQVLGETPNTYQKSAVMENKEETLIEKFAKKGYIRESLIEQWKNEAFDFSKEPDGTLFVVMKNKPYEYVTPEFKNELLNILTRISKQYPDVDVRQQAIEFLNTLGLQEYFDTEAIVNFCNQYIPVLNTHVVESLCENQNTYQVCIYDGDDENAEPECIAIEDSEEDAIERAKYEYTHSDLDENTVVCVIWVENGETLWYIDKDCEEKLNESLNEGVHWDYEYDADDLMADAPVNTPKTEIPENNFTQDDINYIITEIKNIGEKYGFEEEVLEGDDSIGVCVKHPDGRRVCATYYPSAPGFGERWGITLYDANFEEFDSFEPQRGRSWNDWTNEDIIFQVEKMFTKDINESLNEEQGPYFGNDAIGNIAMEIEAGNKSGYEPTEFGNWLLNTSMDTKWEAITEPAKDFLMEKIAMPIADGHVSYDDLEVYVSENSALDKEDVATFEVFSEEELDDIFVNGKELRFLVSYELQFDGQLGESFKEKKKQSKKKKIDDSLNEDQTDAGIYLNLKHYMYANAPESEWLPEDCTIDELISWIFKHEKDAKNQSFWVDNFRLLDKDMDEYGISKKLKNKDDKKDEKNEAVDELPLELKDKINNIIEDEDLPADITVMKNGMVGVEVNGDWKHEHAYFRNKMAAHGFYPVEDELVGDGDSDCYTAIYYFEEPLNEELNEEAVEFMVKSQSGEEGPFANRKAAEDYINQQVQQGKKEEDFEIITNNGENDMSKDNVTQTQTVTESYKVYHTQGAEVVSEVECDSWQGVEEYLNQTWGDYKASRVKENSEFGTEEDKDEFFSNFEIEPIQITLELEEPCEGEECEGEECDVCPECGEAECICEPEEDVPTEEVEEPQEEQPEENLEEDFGEEHVGEPENEEPTEEPEEETGEKIESPEEAADKVDEIEDAIDSIEDFINSLIGEEDEIEELNLSAVTEQPELKDDKNEDFHDGMLTDVSQLDMPDAIAQSIDVNDDGTVMRLKDIMEQVKALKAEMEKTLADFKTDMKDALASLKQDIQRDVNDVDNKVQDTKTAVDGLAVEEEGEFEELEEPMESTEEAPAEEEQPEETEETEENEEEQVEESVKQQGPVNPIAEAIETIIKEGGKTMLMVKEELRDKYGFDTFSPINVPLKNMVEGYIKANKLDKKLISEAQAIREAAESNPAKKFLRKGRLNKLTENLEDAKKKADELIGQGKDAEEIKDAITLLTDNDEEKQQAAEYAVSKMKEQLLKTSKKSKLRSMLSENK